MPSPYFYFDKYISRYTSQEPEKTYTILALTLLTLIFFGALAALPSIKTVKELSREVAGLRSASASLGTKRAAISEAYASLNEAKKYNAVLDVFFAPFGGDSSELASLSGVAARFNIVIESVSVSHGDAVENLNFTARGKHADLRVFLDALEKENLSLDLVGVSFVMTKEDPGTELMKVEAVSYVLP